MDVRTGSCCSVGRASDARLNSHLSTHHRLVVTQFYQKITGPTKNRAPYAKVNRSVHFPSALARHLSHGKRHPGSRSAPHTPISVSLPFMAKTRLSARTLYLVWPSRQTQSTHTLTPFDPCSVKVLLSVVSGRLRYPKQPYELQASYGADPYTTSVRGLHTMDFPHLSTSRTKPAKRELRRSRNTKTLWTFRVALTCLSMTS